MLTRRVLSLLLSILLFLPCTVSAEEVSIPDFSNIRQWDVPDTEPFRFVRRLGAGWNLGNTFDATDDGFRGDDLDLEGYWCGVKTTREMIHALREAGFSTIRIPVSWHNHVDENDQIRKEWMDRVQEVVDWSLDEGLYVIVNVHHDNALKWLYPDSEHLKRTTAYLTSVWSQMAERFRDYDEHLILEAMNERSVEPLRFYAPCPEKRKGGRGAPAPHGDGTPSAMQQRIDRALTGHTKEREER